MAGKESAFPGGTRKNDGAHGENPGHVRGIGYDQSPSGARTSPAEVERIHLAPGKKSECRDVDHRGEREMDIDWDREERVESREINVDSLNV